MGRWQAAVLTQLVLGVIITIGVSRSQLVVDRGLSRLGVAG